MRTDLGDSQGSENSAEESEELEGRFDVLSREDLIRKINKLDRRCEEGNAGILFQSGSLKGSLLNSTCPSFSSSELLVGHSCCLAVSWDRLWSRTKEEATQKKCEFEDHEETVFESSVKDSTLSFQSCNECKRTICCFCREVCLSKTPLDNKKQRVYCNFCYRNFCKFMGYRRPLSGK
jgi:hypothetical protein